MNVSENEVVDYAPYMTIQSSFVQIYTLLCGFMLTVLILLITMLPDPTLPFAQITLFILAIFLTVYGLNLDSVIQILVRCVKVAPPLPQKYLSYWRIIDYITGYGVETAIVLIFLVWNLVYLALATTITVIRFMGRVTSFTALWVDEGYYGDYGSSRYW